MRKVRLLFFTAGIFFSLVSYSQSVTPSILHTTGGHSTWTTYFFEWSFGEAIAIETMSNSPNLIVTTGLLQPGTNTPASINNNGGWGPDEIRILPNPTRDILQINFLSKQKGRVYMMLFDEIGRQMGIQEFDYHGNGLIKTWDFERYASGNYFLNIQLKPTGTSVAKKGTFKVQRIR